MLLKASIWLAATLSVTSGTVLSRPERTLHQRYSANPTTSVLLPFVKGSSAHLNFTNDPSIRYHFSWEGGNSSTHTVLVDTGSVGAVIGAHYFPNWTQYQSQIQQGPAGHILYTSSGKLLTGHFVDVDFEFDDGSLPLKAHAPILVVDRTVLCTNYTRLIDGHYCPKQFIKGPDLCNGLSCENSNFGIGWSRGTNPASNNPLLNIVSVDNTPISAEYTFGYTITDDGLHVGLTEDSTAGFTKVKLVKNSDAKFDWAQVQGCLEFTSTARRATPGACVPGKFLLDTGIDQGYATVTADNGVTGWRYYQDADGMQQAHSQNFTKGWTVTSKFGSDFDPDQYEFAFTLGESPLAPSWLSTSLNATTPASLNTGRHFFRVNDMMYDATNGIWGARLRYGSQVATSILVSPSSTARPISGSLSSIAVPRTKVSSTKSLVGGSQPTRATKNFVVSPTGAGQLDSITLSGASASVTDSARTSAHGNIGEGKGDFPSLEADPILTGSTAPAIGQTVPAEQRPGSGPPSGASGQGEIGQGGSGGSQSHAGC